MSLRKRAVATSLFYPEADGKPMAETELHAQLIINLLEALKNFFANQPDVYVWGNMYVYYVEDDTSKNVAPDVFVVRGVGKRRGERVRRTYKIWEEGVVPCVVIEISSSETKNVDLQRKKQLYAELGVKEYFIFDPEYRYLKPPFRAYRLRGEQYVELAVINRRVRSEELGLDLVDTGETLRLFDPARNEFLRTPEEVAAAQVEAEARAARAEAEREAEAEARRRAEAELEKLRAELARRPRQPAKKRGK
jgi:Uma2 family endonuclease